MLSLHQLIAVCHNQNWQYEIREADGGSRKIIGFTKTGTLWNWLDIYEKDEYREVSEVWFHHAYSRNSGKTMKGHTRGYKLERGIKKIFETIDEYAPVWVKTSDPSTPDWYLAIEGENDYIEYTLINHEHHFKARMDTTSLSSVWNLTWDGCESPLVLKDAWGSSPNNFAERANMIIETLMTGDLDVKVFPDVEQFNTSFAFQEKKYNNLTEKLNSFRETKSDEYNYTYAERSRVHDAMEELGRARVICTETGFELTTISPYSPALKYQSQPITQDVLELHKLYVNVATGSDVRPFEVVSGSKTGKVIETRPMKATLVTKMVHEVGGFASHVVNNEDQEYTYESFSDAPIRKMAITFKGVRTNSGKATLTLRPTKYYDFNY